MVTAGERVLRILSMLSTADHDTGSARLCTVSADALGVSGAGIMLMSPELQPGSICSSNLVSARLEELQYELGEGPSVDAYDQNRPVLEPDLSDPEVPRWVSFTPPAVRVGALAVFGFPMDVGDVRVGALTLYRDRPGPLEEHQLADALVMAKVAAHEVLAMQADAPVDRLPNELEDGANLRIVVHQASGMVAVQLGVSVAEALVRLRAHAFAHDEPLTAIATMVVARQLRFT